MASRGDIAAQNDNYIEPYGSDFSFRTWRNEFTSRTTQLIKVGRGVNVNDVPPTDVPPAVEPCSCTVFTDPFLIITSDWDEQDTSDIATPGPNGYEHLIHPSGDTRQAILQGQFDIGGNFDICVEVDITELPGSIDSASFFEVRLNEGFLQAQARLHIRGAGAGSAEYFVSGNGSWGGPTTFGTITAPSTHLLRFARTDTTLTAYVWNSSSLQWEWDGNPAGNIHDGVWNNDPTATIVWQDNTPGSNNYIGGTCRMFCINVGTKIDP
jgi:hypothetical protein